MPSAATLRILIETVLSNRIPSALTPAQRMIRPVIRTGIAALDGLLSGGFPVGAITEVAGPECSGRTAIALSFLAQITAERKASAWIDVSDALDPESAAAAGVCLDRMLWIRCGLHRTQNSIPESKRFSIPDGYFTPAPVKKGLHGGGFGPHPQTEVKGLSEAVSNLFDPRPILLDRGGTNSTVQPLTAAYGPIGPGAERKRVATSKPFARLEQGLRATDLLLQAGGFSALILDLGSLAPEHATRVPAATWFRYRAAAERTQTSIVLLTQHTCAQSSAGLILRMSPSSPETGERNVFTGIRHHAEVVRERFAAPATNVIPLRKPPQKERRTAWNNRTAWAGCR